MRYKLFALLAFGCTLAACGASRQYRLPIPAAQAKSTFAPIASCATARGFETQELDTEIHVKIDETAWINYGVDVNETYNMALMVDDKAVPAGELDKKFSEVKAKGDDIWACSQASGSAAASAPAPASPAPEPAAAAAAAPSICDKVMSCYAAVARDLCKGGDPGCKNSFEVKMQGGDEQVCRDALRNVPMMVEPFKMAVPGFKMPAECLEGGAASTGGAAAAPAAGGAGGDWAGNWQVVVDYKWSCTVPMAKPEPGKGNERFTMSVSGQPTAMQAQIKVSPSGFNMEGSSSGGGLRLCGAVPLKGKSSSGTSTRNNNVCINMDPMASPSKAMGKVEGSFETNFGIPCKVESGTVEMTR